MRVFTIVTSCITNGSSVRGKNIRTWTPQYPAFVETCQNRYLDFLNLGIVLKVDGQTSDDGVFVFVDQVKMIEKRLLMISYNRAGKTNKQLSP